MNCVQFKICGHFILKDFDLLLFFILSKYKHRSHKHDITFSLSQKEEVTDWRKNVEAMSGMEGRKKLFNTQ